MINSLRDIYDNDENETPLEYDQVENVDTIDCKQPFGTYFSIQLEKIDTSDVGELNNTFYCCEWFKVILEKWLPMAPFWTSLLLGMSALSLHYANNLLTFKVT